MEVKDMAEVSKALETAATEAAGLEAAAEAAEAAVEAAEARAEAAEDAADLMAEAALRDEICGRIDALRTETETCRVLHESTMNGLRADLESLRTSLSALEARPLPEPLVVVPLPAPREAGQPSSTSEPLARQAESQAEGLVVIPAQAVAAAAVPAAPAGQRRGRFL
jgi:hypothetical protein